MTRRVSARLLLKYRGVVRLNQAAEKAFSLSKNVRRIQGTLTDSLSKEFIAVAIPETMGLLKPQRILKSLESAEISCEHIAINMVFPRTGCQFWSSRRAE